MGVCSTVGAAAIGWLVRSILGLFTDLSSWSAQVRLDEDINNLVSEMKRVDGMVLEIAKGKRIDSELLAGSLSNLKDLLYEAEDVLDELDYYRLQDQVIRGAFIWSFAKKKTCCTRRRSKNLFSLSLKKDLFDRGFCLLPIFVDGHLVLGEPVGDSS